MKKIITIILVLFVIIANAQQQPHYTQNQFNSQLEINPAYAGANDFASISLRHRKQWAGFEGAPSTLSFNGEGKVLGKTLAAGLSINRDAIGITQSTSADFSLASHIRVSEQSYISVGIKAGVNFLNSDFLMLTNVDPADPLYVTNKATLPYLGFGALYYAERAYIGFAIPRMVSFENVSPQSDIGSPHYYLYGGYRFTINEDIDLRPALLGKYVAAAPIEADISLDAWYNNVFGVGVSYRTSDAVNVMVKTKINKFHIGYSYDMTVSRLRNYNSGSHEIYIGFEIGSESILNRNPNNRYF